MLTIVILEEWYSFRLGNSALFLSRHYDQYWCIFNPIHLDLINLSDVFQMEQEVKLLTVNLHSFYCGNYSRTTWQQCATNFTNFTI